MRRIVAVAVTGLVAGLAVGGLAVAGLGVARAQSTDPPGSSTTTAPPPAPPGKDAKPGPFGARRFGAFGPGPRWGAKFGGGAIHGEVTSPKPDGGYRTLAFQTGDVTSASTSSLAVKSADGFTRTYKVDEDTLVNAGRDGIGSVQKGDTVRVTALVEGGEARAVNVLDTTKVGKSLDRWRPRRPGR
jgi:hypothetical protein